MNALLKNRDFLALWWVGLASFTIRWLEILVYGVFTYQHTNSAFIVAMMTMLRLVPMALFGVWFGAIAERIVRRSALLIVLTVSLLTAAVLIAITMLGELQVWHLAVASFINGTAWASDNPVRRAMIGEVAGQELMSQAMAIEVGTSNASRLAGPSVGGLLLATTGILGTFVLAVVLYLLALLAAWLVQQRGHVFSTDNSEPAPGWAARLKTLRSDRRLTGAMWLTIIFNVFGWPVLSMVPVIAQDELHLTASGIGLLASTDGLGALISALVLMRVANPAVYGRVYVGGVVAFLAMLPVFALGGYVPLAAFALFIVGAGQGAFAVMQATLTFVFAPPGMRSQAMGMMTMCIGVGPVGFAFIGLLAESIGAPNTALVSSLAGLTTLAISWPWWRDTWRALAVSA